MSDEIPKGLMWEKWHGHYRPVHNFVLPEESGFFPKENDPLDVTIWPPEGKDLGWSLIISGRKMTLHRADFDSYKEARIDAEKWLEEQGAE